MMDAYELIIVGAGPAGMTAGVYAGRKGINTLVISKDIGGQANWTTNIENYMGFRDISGNELMKRFAEQMKGTHLKYEENTVARVQSEDGYFVISTGTNEFRARSVIIATGKRPKMLNVPGEKEFRGKGVSYCSTCDAPFFKNLTVAVVGGGNSAMHAVLDLAETAREINLLMMEPPIADKVLWEKVQKFSHLKIHHNVKVKEIRGDRLVKEVVVQNLTNGREYSLSVEGVFIEIGLDPNSEIVGGLAEMNDLKEILVDCRCQTSVKGLMAAGDVTNVPEKQIIVAAGEGAKAALSAAEYLVAYRRLPGC